MLIDLNNYSVGSIVETDAIENGRTVIVKGLVLQVKNFTSVEEAEIYVDWFGYSPSWTKIWDSEEIVGYETIVRPSNNLKIYQRDYD